VKLLDDEELERSVVVANCRMNRERNLLGSNGYDRELGFDPFAFLMEKVARDCTVAWLDLCCGTGKALIQAAEIIQGERLDVQIVGVDLVGMFERPDPAHLCLHDLLRPDASDGPGQRPPRRLLPARTSRRMRRFVERDLEKRV
jgi:hypothetical protein